MLALALAVSATVRPEVPTAAERREVPSLRVANQHDVAAAPTVAAVRAAAGHVRLAAEADHAVATAAAFYVDLGSVEEHAAKVAAAGGVCGPRPCRDGG
jgi:hypothetical protein